MVRRTACSHKRHTNYIFHRLKGNAGVNYPIVVSTVCVLARFM